MSSTTIDIRAIKHQGDCNYLQCRTKNIAFEIVSIMNKIKLVRYSGGYQAIGFEY